MHVDGAYSTIRAQNPQLNTYAYSPTLGYQRSSRSDITSARFFDRTPGLQKPVRMLRKLKDWLAFMGDYDSYLVGGHQNSAKRWSSYRSRFQTKEVNYESSSKITRHLSRRLTNNSCPRNRVLNPSIVGRPSATHCGNLYSKCT